MSDKKTVLDAPLCPGALVAFLGQEKAFTVKKIGRAPVNWGGGEYVELQELPGEFAIHLFRRIAE
jgi:hypothetical protein